MGQIKNIKLHIVTDIKIFTSNEMSDKNHVSCGRDFTCVPDIRSCLQVASGSGFDFVCVPIVHPRYKREPNSPQRPGAFTRSDLLLPGSDWSSLVVGKLSPWIKVDSKCDRIRTNSQAALKQELAFALHLSLPAICVRLTSGENMQLSQMLNHTLLNTHVQQIWARVPLRAPSETCERELMNEQGCTRVQSKGDTDTWEWWNRLRCLCDNSKKLAVVLELNDKTVADDAVINRWVGEPLKAVVLPTNIFLTNKKGYPVLSRENQVVVNKFFKLSVQFIISGAVLHKNLMYYYQYLDHLYSQQEMDSIEQFSRGYEDYLQTPLQPLMDNLESQTYEVFEKDPVKYAEYQRAVKLALLDRVPEEKKGDVTTVIMVVGAGRGPLVRASFNAAKEADRKVKMYAVEKNPNAIVTLETLNEEEWNNTVTVVSSDMRFYDAPEQADILVSELLGSFSDNELSPECLDGAQKFLKEGGISIPSRYTSYACPLSSPKLYAEVAACREVGKHPDAHFECPYVVRLQNVNYLADSQPVFVFDHPNYTAPVDNERYIKLDFTAQHSSMVHGVSGFFDMVLYKEVELSINLKTASPGMFSWFPAFFPIKNPIYVREGEKVELHFWRKVDKTKVWYEWCLTSPQQTPIHNPGGRSYWIGLV